MPKDTNALLAQAHYHERDYVMPEDITECLIMASAGAAATGLELHIFIATLMEDFCEIHGRQIPGVYAEDHTLCAFLLWDAMRKTE